MNEIPFALAPVAGAQTAAPGAPGAAPAGAVDFELLLAAALAVSDPAAGIAPELAALVAAPPQPGENPAPAQSAAPAAGLEIAALSAAAAAAQALVAQPPAAAPQAETPQTAPQRTPPTAAAPAAFALGAFEAEASPAAQSAASPHALAARLSADAAAPQAEREATPQPTEAMSAEPARAPSHVAAPRGTEPIAAAPLAALAAPVRAPTPPAANAPLRPGTPAFADHFCARVQLELSAGNAAARIEVSPPELGPVELHIRVADGAAHLACAAPHPATREAILEALPRLRDMLAAQGLALGDASVGAELPGRERGDARAPRAPAADAAPGEAAARALAPAAPVLRRGLLDVFA